MIMWPLAGEAGGFLRVWWGVRYAGVAVGIKRFG